MKQCPNCGRTWPDETRFCPHDGAALTVSITEESPEGQQLGHYRILRALGKGGVGTVYQAEHLRLGRRAAIKILSRSMAGDPEAVARFNREAVTAARIQHPNVCTIYEIGETPDGRTYLAMEFIEGRSLAEILGIEGTIDPVRAAAISLQVARGLQAAHDQGIVHRDLKPSNIMISTAPGFLEAVKVVDFGIAKAFDVRNDQALTRTGMIIGTPEYMSPEQLTGDQTGPASDVYALALVHFRMLTGSLPFTTGTGPEMMMARLTGRPLALREVRPELVFAPDIQRVLDMALARAPEDRFASAEEFGAALADATGVGPDVERSLAPRGPASVVAPRRPPRDAEAVRRSRGVFGWLKDRFPTRDRSSRPSTSGQHSAGPIRDDHGRGVDTVIPGQPSPLSSRPPSASPQHASAGEAAGFTRVVRPSDWAPARAEPGVAPERAAEFTRMFAVPGSTTQPTRFPVALTLTHSPDPSRVGIRFACEHFPFSVGRAESADLSVPADDALSRVHLEIDRDEGGFLVRDLSTNGIWVNGQHLKGRSAPLHFGTTLVLSKGTSLTFVADIPVLPDLSGEVLDGRYRLESRLHSSVKAATYRSQDVRVPKVSRAIKIFSPTLMNLANYRAEFERQATLAAQLQHPHICKVLDFGTAPVRVAGRLEPCSWLCMELMEGGNLADRLEEGLPALDTVKTWVGDVAAALAHAHRNGVAHGDLKPGCVVFDREGTAYLTDFALARSGEPESKTAVVGIPAYLAPEQWEGGLPTEATDQYSLAVLAYQMVTGSRPHEGQSVPEVRARNFQRGPAPAHEEAGRAGRESVSPAVSAVLARALSPDPAARFPDVLEFSQAFARGVTDPYQPAAKPRVFISYRRRVASGWAITFATALQDKHGCSVFVDTRALDGAPRIPDRVRKEIERCDVFVCLLAPETLGSDWVRQEIAIADDCRKPMVPIFFQEFEPRDVDTSADPHLETLLDHEAVRLYDRDADYVDAAIGRLSDRIRSLMRPS